jgi:hypothetical protein
MNRILRTRITNQSRIERLRESETVQSPATLSSVSRRMQAIETVSAYITADTDLESVLRSENLPFALDALRAAHAHTDEVN